MELLPVMRVSKDVPITKTKLPRWGATLLRLGFVAWMTVGVWLLVSASWSYVELGREHPFYLEKLPLAHPKLWLTALYVHVPSALFALPACLLLTSNRLRMRWPTLHHWLGRVAGGLVLLAVVPSGMVLAPAAQGGAMTVLGFWLTGAIAWVAMVYAVLSARRGDFKAHRRFAAHVTAQLSVAVVSRFMLVGIEALELYSEHAYTAALWVPVIGCAWVAELMTAPRGRWISNKGASDEALVAMPRVDLVR